MKRVRPMRGSVLLLDDQPGVVADGEVAVVARGSVNMDYLAVRVDPADNPGFGQGDRVVISDPNLGERLAIDGSQYRLVRVSDVVAVVGGREP